MARTALQQQAIVRNAGREIYTIVWLDLLISIMPNCIGIVLLRHGLHGEGSQRCQRGFVCEARVHGYFVEALC